MKLTKLFLILSVFSVWACAGPEEKTEDEIKNAEWHYKMCNGYFESREIPLAIRSCHASIEKDPKHVEANFLLGMIYHGRREYDKALGYYTAAIESDPKYLFAYNNRGTLLIEMGRYRDAKADFEKLIDDPLYPTPQLAQNNLGLAYFHMKKYSKALEHYRMAAFLKPEMCLAYHNMGETYLKMDQRTEAAENFQKAINKCPNNFAKPRFELGKLMQEEGMASAKEHFQKCVEIEPESNLGRRCRQYLQIQ